jgi:hypothetical protein
MREYKLTHLPLRSSSSTVCASFFRVAGWPRSRRRKRSMGCREAPDSASPHAMSGLGSGSWTLLPSSAP